MDSELTLEESPEGFVERLIVGPKCWPRGAKIAYYLTFPLSAPVYWIAWWATAGIALAR